MDGGIQAARKGQDTGVTGYLSAEEGIRDCVDLGAQVYVDGSSLEAEGVAASDLIDGITVVKTADIAAVMMASGTTMIF